MAVLIYKLEQLMAQAERNQMNIDLYTDVYHEWLKFMGFFGAIISLAFSDISDKATKIMANKLLINSFLIPANHLLTIEKFIDFEFSE